MTRRVVITGMGVVSPLGCGTEIFGQNLLEGRSGVKRITRFSVKDCPCQIAAQVDEEILEKNKDSGSWVDRMALHAAREAWSHAGFGNGFVPKRVGLGLSLGWEMQDVTIKDSNLKASFSLVPELGRFRDDFRLDGPQITCFSACAAGTQLVEEAARSIRLGEADYFLVGAADSRIHPMGLWGYTRLGALATGFNEDPARGSRPFDRRRSGFVMGEGAGFLALEEKNVAEQRGATVHAEILGAASTGDAWSVTAPAEDGEAAARCISLSLERAGVAPGEIDYINAHGTSTPANDAAEVRALELALGPRASNIPVGSFKSMIGHLAMASGLVEIIGSVLAMNRGILPPNLNLEDSEFGLNFAGPRSRQHPMRKVLKTSFGFGGQNSSVLLGSIRA